MTARTGLFVAPDGSGNGTTPVGARLALATLLGRAGASPLAVREGVIYDGGGNVVSGNTDTSPMSYNVRAAGFVQCTTATNGATVSANDGTVKVPTTAAPATDKRIDVVWFRQHHIAGDGGTDSNTILELGVTQGATAASPSAPAIPTDATELGRATVPAGTTSTSQLTITQTHLWTSLHGAPIPVRSQAERDALVGFEGLRALRLDTKHVDVYTSGAWDDGAWKAYTPGLSGITLGSGSCKAYFRKEGRTVTGRIRFAAAADTTFQGGATLRFGLPTNYGSDYDQVSIGTAYLLDGSAGSTTRTAAQLVCTGANTVFLIASGRTGPNTVTDTAPWTWASGDIIAASFQYEADA